MDNISMYQKYDGMYFRIGVINDRITGMEWMDENYHFGTFRQITENLTSMAFCIEILTLCLINSPNTSNLLKNVGVFGNRENIYESKLLFNSDIDKIIIEAKNNLQDFTKSLKIIVENFPIKKAQILPILKNQCVEIDDFLFEAITSNDSHKVIIKLNEYVDNDYFNGFEIKFL